MKRGISCNEIPTVLARTLPVSCKEIPAFRVGTGRACVQGQGNDSDRLGGIKKEFSFLKIYDTMFHGKGF